MRVFPSSVTAAVVFRAFQPPEKARTAGLLVAVGALLCAKERAIYFKNIFIKPKCRGALKEKSSLPAICGQDFGYMNFVEDLLQRQCDLVDVLRGQEESYGLRDGQEVDFIVVGAGSGGSVVAGRLAQAHEHWEVALLEAGGPYPTGTMLPGSYFSYGKPESPINWNFAIERQGYACLGYKNGTCLYPRGKVLGGTGVLHGMMYMRGNPYDYDNWASKGIKGWSYEEVLPYFKISEYNLQIGEQYSPKYHGEEGPVPVSQFPDQPKIIEKMLRAAEEMHFSTNYDLNGDDQIGFTIAQATTYNGTRVSMYNAYIEPLLGSFDNIYVSPYSHVTRVLLDNHKAVGVEYMKGKKKMHLYARKEVIISAGAIQSAQILLLSGIGPKEHLKDVGVPVVKHLPMVGKNMQNHVAYTVKFKLKDYCDDNLLNNDSLYEFLHYREGPMTSTGLSQFTGFVRVNEKSHLPSGVPDTQIFSSGFLAGCSESGKVQHGTTCKKQRYITLTPTLLHPKSRGIISLRSKNPMDPPLIHVNYLQDEDDRRSLINGIHFVLKMAQTSALKDSIELDNKPVTFCESEKDTDRYWECAIRYWTNPENHQTGSCSMGTNEESSVVDPELRVHGVERLRVIDASIMPTIISGNINAPVIMVAEKGADMILSYWYHHYYHY